MFTLETITDAARRAFVASLAFACTVAAAGDFVALPTTGAPVQGRNNQNTDPLYLNATAVTYLSAPEAPVDTIPGSITYTANATSGSRPVTGTGVLSLLAYRFTADVQMQGQPIGHVYDFVFRDSRDNKLVFGTRVTLAVTASHSQNAEINFAFRHGFQDGTTPFEVSAGWLRLTDSDLRLYGGARTRSNSLTAAPVFDAESVRLQSDINASEGNPLSALMLIKTDAPYYKPGTGAVEVFQAGEEGQARVGVTLNGFVPTSTDPDAPTIVPTERARATGGKLLPRRNPGQAAVPFWRALSDAWGAP